MAKKKKPLAPAIETGKLRLEYRTPAELAENPANWRRHPDTQLAALTNVIAEVGWAGACLFNETTGRLIDGHARRKIALDQGAASVPVLVGAWTEEQERKILATLDPLAVMAEADAAALDALLSGMTTDSESLRSMLDGLSRNGGLARGLPEPGGGGDEFDPGPPLDETTRVQSGDLWIIGGKHRLLCGDSTSEVDVSRLLDRPADLIVTDPPYGVDFKRGQFITDPSRPSATARGVRDDIDGDSRKAQSQQAFIRAVFETARPRCRPGCSIYMFSATLVEGSHSMLGLGESGVHIQSQLVWVKNNLVLGIADYQWKHEVCWYGWYEGAAHRWFGERNKTTVLEFARVQATFHPNEKPIDLISHMIGNSSLTDERVYEPFGGSGTTIIAAHRLGRECAAIEIDPRYCEAILRRAEAEGLVCEKTDG